MGVHYLRIVLTSLILCGLSRLVSAQPPDWDVNENDFPNQMNVIGFLRIDGVESMDSEDLIGAFSGEEVRGVASPQFQETLGRSVVFMTVFGNDAGEEITFQIFDASQNRIVDGVDEVIFIPNVLLGGLENSFVWSNQILNDDAFLLSYGLPGQVGGEDIQGTEVAISVNTATDLTSLIADFEISPGASATISGVVQESGVNVNDYSSPLTMRVQSENGLEIIDYIISVTTVNQVPNDLVLSGNSVAENNAVGEVIGEFSVVDDDTEQFYVLAAIEGAEDNALFSISENQLLANESFDFESGSELTIGIRVSDPVGNSLESLLSITVLDVNEAPVLASSLAPFSLEEDVSFQFTVDPAIFSDEDESDSLTLSVGQLPDWLNFDTNTGELSGIPANEDVGETTIVLTATDREGALVEVPVLINVSNVNDAPVLVGNINDQSALVGELFNFVFDPAIFEEVDANDALRIEVSSELPAWLSFTASTSSFVGVPDLEDVGVFAVVLTATDNSGESAVTSFDVSVVTDNQAPVDLLLSNSELEENNEAGALVGEFSVTDDDTEQFYVLAAIEGAENNGLFSISGNQLLANESFDFELGSTFTIGIRVSDPAGNSLESILSVTVLDVNEAPVLVNTLAPFSLEEDVSFQFTVDPAIFSDEDEGDSLTLSVGQLPDWLNFDITTGELTGTPANEDVGETTIVLTATDRGGALVEVPVLINVLNVNDAPVVVGAISDQQAEVGELFDFTFDIAIFQDPDEGDELNITLTSNLPEWLSFRPEINSFIGVPTQDDAGTITIALSASDLAGEAAEISFDIVVNGIVTSTNDFPDDIAIQVFPNPTSDFLTVSGEGLSRGSKLRFYDLRGVLMLSASLGIEGAHLEVSHLPEGIYLMRLEVDKVLVTRKILISR